MGLEDLTQKSGTSVCEHSQNFTTYDNHVQLTVSVMLRRDIKLAWRRLDVLLLCSPGKNKKHIGVHLINALYDLNTGEVVHVHEEVDNAPTWYLPKLLPVITDHLNSRVQYCAPFIPVLYAVCEKVAETPN